MFKRTFIVAGLLAGALATPVAAQDQGSPPPQAQVNGFSYAMISVTDMAKAKAFYLDLLGLKVAFEQVHGSPLGIGINRSGSPASAEFTLLLQQAPAGAASGPIAAPSAYTGPIGIWVTGIETYLARAQAAGVPIVRGLSSGGGAIRTIVLRDPDGLIVELLEAGRR